MNGFNACFIAFTIVSLAQPALVTDPNDTLIKDIRSLVGPSVDDAVIRRLVNRANQGKWSSNELLDPFRGMKISLVVVDFQNDFVNGSLSIKNGAAGQDPRDAIPTLNALLIEGNADLVVYTLDWHPPNHISFIEHARDGGRKLSEQDSKRQLKPFDVVRFDVPAVSQVLYPSHCVQGSWGAQLDPNVHVIKGAHYITKGEKVLVDSYSAFQDNEKNEKTPLEALLRENEIDAVIGCGLAYEICVAATLKDSADMGFYTAIVADASKGLDSDKIRQANEDFRTRNIAILSAREAISTLSKGIIPIEWIEKRLDDLKQG